MGDIPMDPMDIIPFRDKTPGDENPPKNGFCMLLSPGNIDPIVVAGPLVVGFAFFPSK
jgi:hypothetical protein